MNASNTFELAGQAEILTSGSIDPSKVIFNVGVGVSELKVTGGGTVFPGMILAPGTNLPIAGGSTIKGAVISGGRVKCWRGGFGNPRSASLWRVQPGEAEAARQEAK